MKEYTENLTEELYLLKRDAVTPIQNLILHFLNTAVRI